MTTNQIEPQYFSHQQLTIIEPARGWSSLHLRELYAYRGLLWVLVMRDIRVRYKQTVLGIAWAVLQPVMTMIVFSVIFGRLAGLPSDGQPYPIFVYAGLLPWLFFSNSVAAASNSLVGSQHLVSKVYFPRLIVPIAAIGSCLLDLAISSLVLLAMMAWYGIPLQSNLFLSPILIAALAAAAIGFGSGLAALTVTYRDFRFVVPFFLQIWLYLTPVAYASSLIPKSWQWALLLNPLAGIVSATRTSFLGGSFDVMAISTSLLAGVAFLVLGVLYFGRVERRFADVI